MNDAPQYEWVRRQMIEVLHLLSADAKTQVASLAGQVVTDEIVQDWTNCEFMLPTLCKVGLLSEAEVAAAAVVSTAVERLLANEDWNAPGAMSLHPAWSQLRVHAADAVRVFGEEPRPPDPRAV